MRRFLLTKPLTVLLSVLCAATLSPVFVGAAHAESGLQSVLTARNGAQGTGHVDFSPTADDQNDTVFIGQGTAEIHGAKPNMTYFVQRAVNLSHVPGICEVDPSGPWRSPTFPVPTTITTSPGGAGAEHFVRFIPSPFKQGFQFDIVFRVVEQNVAGMPPDLPQLISACMTVTAK